MRDPAELVEMNRFVGREFLLWLWFESELYETNLKPTQGDACALWLENHITLANEAEEARIKSSTPGTAPEAKQALRQGKLPRDTRLKMVLNELEFGWTMKADDLAIAALKVPSELKADDNAAAGGQKPSAALRAANNDEALYERMRLVEILEKQLEALFTDFLSVRLHEVWEGTVVPEMRRWARGKSVDEKAYASAKRRAIPPGGRRMPKP
ncbi:MAG: hypothetical protein U0271_18045 [Polyangiaceae bacterium]